MHSHTQHSLAALVLDRASSEEFKGNGAKRGGDEQTEQTKKGMTFLKHLFTRCKKSSARDCMDTPLFALYLLYLNGDSDISSLFCFQH